MPEPPAPVRVKSRVMARVTLDLDASPALVPTKLVRGAGRLCLPAEPVVSSQRGRRPASHGGNLPAAISSCRGGSRRRARCRAPRRGPPEAARTGRGLARGLPERAYRRIRPRAPPRRWAPRPSPSQRLDGRARAPALFVQPRELDEQREVQLPQLFAPVLRPLLVAVLGQELSRVQVQRRPVGRRLPYTARRLPRPPRRLDVHPQLALRAQHERLALRCQVAEPPCRIENLRGRRGGSGAGCWRRAPARVGPEESMLARGGGGGQERGRAASPGRPPSSGATLVPDGPAPYRNPKPAEQPHPHRLEPLTYCHLPSRHGADSSRCTRPSIPQRGTIPKRSS